MQEYVRRRILYTLFDSFVNYIQSTPKGGYGTLGSTRYPGILLESLGAVDCYVDDFAYYSVRNTREGLR